MITIKSPHEIDLMREAGRIVAETHQLLEESLRPGMSTLELDEIAERYIRSKGAIPSFKNYCGFPGSICASINEVVVHGIPSRDIIVREGDIISFDVAPFSMVTMAMLPALWLAVRSARRLRS